MIAKLTGIVDSSNQDSMIIDVGGVGYLVFCSTRTLNVLGAVSGTVSVLIETHVREDHIHLFGFADEVEREWFKLLTTVQGVGARVALAILSVLSSEVLVQAVAAADKAAITQAPGVGPKLATRIITELKDKMGGIALGAGAFADAGAGSNGGEVPAEDSGQNQAASDAISALVNLGYGRSEAFGAVAQAARKLGPEAGVEALIKDGLGELGTVEARG